MFRTVEDASVESRPRNSPFSGANLFLGGRMYSIGTRQAEVTAEQESEIGLASACAVVTTSLVPEVLVPFYAVFTFHEGSVYAAQELHRSRPPTFPRRVWFSRAVHCGSCLARAAASAVRRRA